VDRKGVLIFTIEVTDYRQLQEIMGAIKRIKNVIQVERI
jgi:(p)ppGpp synthase/HD superfamily hydrolase